MEHYIVRAVFQEFFAHLKANMKPADRKKLCLVFRNHEQLQEIHVSTTDEEIKTLIVSKYTLLPAEHPQPMIDAEPDAYTFLGNRMLIEEG
ncbi:MAG: hypothetical protein Q8S18_01930 [Bacteroidales bacterium]|nr:hypothetical protein [Bacteroidales bacterium]